MPRNSIRLATLLLLGWVYSCDESSSLPPPNPKGKLQRVRVKAADVVAGLKQANPGRTPTSNSVSQTLTPSATVSIGPDEDYAGEDGVETAFLVYRAQLRVPVIQGFVSRVSHRPTAELHIWSSSERLRAKFVGNAWPVGDGAEVRLRADRPGAVVVDASGMRSLGPGQLAHWFTGTPLTRRAHANAAVAMVSEKEAGGPRHLLCELLAEWTSQPRSTLAPRCSVAGPNPRLRVGHWWAIRTVSMYQTLPKRRLRTDQTLTEPLNPAFQPIHARPAAGQSVTNRYARRLLAFSGGHPWGWFDPKEHVQDAPCLKGVRAAVDAFGNGLRVAALRHHPITHCFEAFASRATHTHPVVAITTEDASKRRSQAANDASVSEAP